MARDMRRKHMRSTYHTRTGIFLHYGGSDYIARLSAFFRDSQLHPYWGKIQDVDADFEIVSNLVPGSLQEGAESWLVLYRTELSEEFLVLPFPDQEELPFLDSMDTLRRYVLNMLELIGGGREPWFPSSGFLNLIQNIKRTRLLQPHPFPRRFQVVRINKPLENLLREPQVSSRQVEEQEISFRLMSTSQRIRRGRDEMLALILMAEDEDQKQHATQEFETFILEESSQLAEWVLTKHTTVRQVPPVVHHFKGVMDEETERFLISAETVARFASEQLPNDFDFSLSGCGLWKAVERELNLSLIWHLRRENGLAGDNPLKPIASKGKKVVYEAGNQSVNLNKRDKSPNENEFKGVGLGNLEHLLRSAKVNNITQEIEPALDDELLPFFLGKGKDDLASLLERLRNIRNGYAHIKAMSYSQYQELRSLVLLLDEKSSESLLGKVLRMKLAIRRYWEKQNSTRATRGKNRSTTTEHRGNDKASRSD